MPWRLWPQPNDIYYRIGSQEFIPDPSDGIDLSGSVEPDNVLPVSGGLTVGGSVGIDSFVLMTTSGGLTVGGTAIRADINTLPVSGGLAVGGSAVREGESVLVPSGGLTVGGTAVVETSEWEDSQDWSYEQQGD